MHSKGPFTATFNGEPDDDIWDVHAADGELLAVSVSKSDAALIAAAPLMLAELRGILDADSMGAISLAEHHRESIKAAIAAAEGRSE